MLLSAVLRVGCDDHARVRRERGCLAGLLQSVIPKRDMPNSRLSRIAFDMVQQRLVHDSMGNGWCHWCWWHHGNWRNEGSWWYNVSS